jgi:hypothetical protein
MLYYEEAIDIFTSANCPCQGYESVGGHHSSNKCCLAILKDGYQNLEDNICCTIVFSFHFFWVWLQKHVIKPKNYHLRKAIGIYTFSKITISLCPQNGADGQNLGVWLTI